MVEIEGNRLKKRLWAVVFLCLKFGCWAKIEV